MAMEYLDDMTVEQIKLCISVGKFSEQDVIDHYNNEWWDQV